MNAFGLCFLPWWSWLIVTPVAIAAALYYYTVYKHGYFRRRGIKGPQPQPYWGNVKTMMAEGLDKFDRRCAEEFGPIWGFYYGNHPSLIVGDPEIIKEITVKQFSKFYNRAEVVEIPKIWKNSVNNARGTKWKYLRAILQPTFSSSKIKSMRPILKRCLNEFISCLDDELAKSEDLVIDMYDRFKALTMDVICSTAFGIEVNSQRNADDLFVKHASKVLGTSLTSTVLMLNLFFPDLRKLVMFFCKDWVDEASMNFLTTTVKEAMEVRKQDKSGEFTDLLKLMMDTQTEHTDTGVSEDKSFEEMKEGGMSEDDITINGVIFLAAGYETTASLLAFMTYCLATNPEYQERLLNEIDLISGSTDAGITYDNVQKMEFLDMFLQETLRMYPPAGRFNRQPACDVTINGIKFEKDTDVTFSTHVMHRNPKYWPEPDKFDPERFSPENMSKIEPCAFIPFGTGPRNCIGMKLALAEAKMSIVRLLQVFRVEKSAKLVIPPPMNTAGGITRPRDGVFVKLVRR